MKSRQTVWLVALVAVASLDAAGNSVKLVDAVKQGNRAAVRALITERANVNAAEPDGMTPLHWAVRGDDLQTAQLLIRAGANVKATSRYGITPISLAAQNGNAPLVE